MAQRTTTQRENRRLKPTSRTHRSLVEVLRGEDDVNPLPVALTGAVLCVGVSLVHIQDQGGFLGDQSPLWIAVGYYLIEIAGGITAAVLIRQKVVGWLLAMGVGLCPFVAYILSRSVGVPGDSDDIGNWGYLLGTVSLVFEGVLVILAIVALLRLLGQKRRPLT